MDKEDGKAIEKMGFCLFLFGLVTYINIAIQYKWPAPDDINFVMFVAVGLGLAVYSCFGNGD